MGYLNVGDFILILLVMTAVGIWLFAISNVISSIFKKDSDKIYWALMVTLIPIAGPIYYFFKGSKDRIIE